MRERVSEPTGNPYLDRFTQHPLHLSCTALEVVLHSAEARATDDLAALNGTHRLRAVVNALRVMLRNADPLLVPSGQLDQLHNTCINATNELKGFADNGGPYVPT